MPTADGDDITGRTAAQSQGRTAGRDPLLARLLIGLLTGGHLVAECVPDLAQGLAVLLHSLAEAMHLSVEHVPLTADLLPADVVGTMMRDPGNGPHDARKVPNFANLLLVDRIDLASPAVRSLLLEVMQEHQVALADGTFPLPEPFMIVATQSPDGRNGGFPLSETQVDRFMLKLRPSQSGLPSGRNTIRRLVRQARAALAPAATPGGILEVRRQVLSLHMSRRTEEYIVDAVQATREPLRYGLDQLAPLLATGASPRATIYLAAAARAHAFLWGRDQVLPGDVRAVGPDVLGHRVRTQLDAGAELASPEGIIGRIFDALEDS